jgi:hypothetical protein
MTCRWKERKSKEEETKEKSLEGLKNTEGKKC